MKESRIAINSVLFVCAVALAFICYRSIKDREEFNTEVVQRENLVKARLMEIRAVEEAYKAEFGHYCPDWDSLIAYINVGQLPTIMKQGVLSDWHLEQGITEARLARILHSANNSADIEKYRLWNFVRDTVWSSLKDSLLGPDYDVNQICIIPTSDNEKFTLETDSFMNKSQIMIQTMQCMAPFAAYLHGDRNDWKREKDNREKDAEDRGVFGGLKIGEEGEAWNNNAGNWE